MYLLGCLCSVCVCANGCVMWSLAYSFFFGFITTFLFRLHPACVPSDMQCYNFEGVVLREFAERESIPFEV